MINIRKLEAELWESADLLRAGSKLTSNQYCMPVLGLIFLRYAYSRFKMVEAEILKNRPSRGGKVMPVEASDFAAKSALFLPKEAQYDYLLNLPDDISAAGLLNKDGQPMTSLMYRTHTMITTQIIRILFHIYFITMRFLCCPMVQRRR